jgi:uncharacterized protein YkwD
MKNYQKILILIIIILSLYILRDDLSLFINKTKSRFLSDNQNLVIDSIDRKEILLPVKINMPGTLRVVDNLINSKINLSKDNIINFTNKYRKENGDLVVLKENHKLNLSAQEKLQDMFTEQYFDHISPAGVGIGDLGDQVGYQYLLIGENLAMGNFKDDLALVDAWMASPGHRENILNKNYTEIGIAVAKGRFEGRDIWMAVQHFGTPLETCSVVDSVLQGLISINQKKIKIIEEDISIRIDKINRGIIYEGKTQKEQISTYNSLINSYNNLINETKEKINIYNQQVKSFNDCLIRLSAE